MKAYALFFLLLIAPLLLFASDTAQLNVNFTIPEFNDIVIKDASIDLTLTYNATPGNIYNTATAHTTYSINTSGGNKRIMASINQNMPEHTYLSILATAPNGAQSLSEITLTSSPQDIVTGILPTSQTNLLLTIKLKADIGAPTVVDARTITLSIMD